MSSERELSPPSTYEPEKKKEDRPEKSKFRKPAPPPMDFNQLLKLAEQKKSEPIDVAAKKVVAEPEPDRLMTKKQKREYEEEMARRQRRQERMDAAKSSIRKVQTNPKGEKQPAVDKETKPDAGIGRIPKLNNSNNHKNNVPKTHEREREKAVNDKEKLDKIQREKEKFKLEREKVERERLDRERLEKLKAERDRIDKEMERLNKDTLDKSKPKFENRSSEKSVKPPEKIIDRSKLNSRDQTIKQTTKKSIDLKTQNTYRIDKASEEKRVISSKTSDNKVVNGHSSHGKLVPKLSKEQVLATKGNYKDKMMTTKQKTPSEGSQKINGHVKLDNNRRLLEIEKSSSAVKKTDERRPLPESAKPRAGPSKPKVINSFDFDKHVNSLSKNGTKQYPPGDVKRKAHCDDMKKKRRRMVDSDSEHDSEMDDFIDDADDDMDYSRHIKDIFGYDKSKYRDMDDDDDPMMESSFARQQREEYVSKKIGIMEDLEDMRMEAIQKKKSKRRRLSDY